MTELQISSAKKPSLFTAIAIGVSCMIGSGWLFAAYYAAQHAGPSAIFSWIIGAAIALILAMLLAEISTITKARGLFSRLTTLSHNRDFGFVVAISNWLGLIMTVPSEAEATVQYLSSSYSEFQHLIFYNKHLTLLGILTVCALIVCFSLVNYWGIKLLAKVNNVVTALKLIIPIVTVVLLVTHAFHTENFTAYNNSFAPYGVKHIFSAVVVCGIFYAFYGFGMVAIFGAELDNPKRNIPIALMASVGICLVIYLLLQVAFIGALPTSMVMKGWHNINFTSPLAQVLILLNINFWAIVLYLDSAMSPSATATVYLGSGARMLTGMSHDRQMPKFFGSIHPTYNISHSSLIFTMLISFTMVAFFKNWQDIMIMTAVFQLITCIAIPIAFTKFRETKSDVKRSFRVGFGKTLSLIIFILVTYLLTQASFMALFVALMVHFVLFVIYLLSYYKTNLPKIINASKSTWSMFAFLIVVVIFGYCHKIGILLNPLPFLAFLLSCLILYFLMVNQKEYAS